MEYMRGWRAMRQDPDGSSKVGVACLLLLSATVIPIVGQVALMGWTTLMMRRAVSGQDTPLPELRLDFGYLGKLMGVGFKAFLAQMLYSLPLFAVLMVTFCCFYVGGVMVTVTAARSAGDPGVGGAGFLVVALIFMVLYPILMIVGSLPLHVALLRAELMDDISAAIRPKEVLGTTRMLFKELLIGNLVVGLLGFALVMGGLALCYIGAFPAAVVAMIISTYWRAEVYRVYLEKGGAPLPIGALDVAPKEQPVRF